MGKGFTKELRRVEQNRPLKGKIEKDIWERSRGAQQNGP
jgi:hypothetical protein